MIYRRPDCESPNESGNFGKPPNRRSVYRKSQIRQAPYQKFLEEACGFLCKKLNGLRETEKADSPATNRLGNDKDRVS